MDDAKGKIVYLTSGPRGSGKSHFVSLVTKDRPEILVVDRDALFIENFGGSSLDPYSGMMWVAQEILEQKIRETITLAPTNSKIIIDAWNGYGYERRKLIEIFRSCGANLIICWYFVTPLSQCLEWFRKKPGLSHSSEYGITWDYNLYHKKAGDLNRPKEKDPILQFDFDTDCSPDIVEKINPLQMMLPGINII